MVAREDLKWKTLENRYYIEDKLRKMLQQEFPEMKEAQFELSVCIHAWFHTRKRSDLLTKEVEYG